MKKQLIILVMFVIAGQLAAQEDHTIIATGEREVERAIRISSSPLIIDTVLSSPTVEYPLLVVRMDTKTEVEKITPASINTKEKLSELYHTYVKLGIGSELMPLGEVYFDSKRSRKFIYGAHVKHLSSFGNIKGYAPAAFDRTKSLVYGSLNEKTWSLHSDFNYNNQGLHYYAFPSDTLHKDSIAQRYQDLGISSRFVSNKKDSANVNYQVGVNYNHFSSKKPEDKDRENWRASENYFAIQSGAWYKLNKEVYALDLTIRYNGYRYGKPSEALVPLDSGVRLENTVINLKPHITTQLKNDRFRAVIGLDFAIDVHKTSKAHVYPLAEVKYSLFNDIFIPYVGIRGGLKQQTFKSLTRNNEFLHPGVALLNENTPIDFYGGFKGSLSRRITFNTGISFARVQNKALFVNDTLFSAGNRFLVIYDTMNITQVEASISYQLNEKLKIDGIGRYFSYETLNNSYAWHLPQLQFVIRGHYNLFDKFLINLDLNMEEGRRALVYQSGEGVKEENGQLYKKLDFIADINLGVEYRYNSRISAFIEFNNVAAQRYKRWYQSPVHGFQVLGGVSFRF